MIESTLASDILLGVLGLLVGLGIVGGVLAFWSMGRAAYRKD